jgi:hypothetical protein
MRAPSSTPPTRAAAARATPAPAHGAQQPSAAALARRTAVAPRPSDALSPHASVSSPAARLLRRLRALALTLRLRGRERVGRGGCLCRRREGAPCARRASGGGRGGVAQGEGAHERGQRGAGARHGRGGSGEVVGMGRWSTRLEECKGDDARSRTRLVLALGWLPAGTGRRGQDRAARPTWLRSSQPSVDGAKSHADSALTGRSITTQPRPSHPSHARRAAPHRTCLRLTLVAAAASAAAAAPGRPCRRCRRRIPCARAPLCLPRRPVPA